MARSKGIKPNGQLHDAKRDLVLTVTAKDIATARRKEIGGCAAANALCRQGGFRQAHVHKTTTYVQLKDGTWERYRTPGDLYVYVIAFDLGAKFPPGEFLLKAPTGIYRLGQHVKPKGPKKVTGKPRKRPHIIENVRANAPKGRALFQSFENA